MDVSSDIDTAIDRLVLKLVRNDPEHWADAECTSCNGRGTIHGSVVDYQGYPVTTPTYTCDCPHEEADMAIRKMVATGELQIDYDTDGIPYLTGVEEAGIEL